MKSFKGLLCLLFVMLLLLGCIACSNTTENEEQLKPDRLTIAFSQSCTVNQWKITESNSIIEECETRGYRLLYKDALDDPRQQLQDILDLVESRPDYLVITPREYTGLEAGVRAAREAGIPVILIERWMNGTVGEDFVTLISTDVVWQGEQCAKYLLKEFEGTTCNVVELTGPASASASIDRGIGFQDGLEGAINVGRIATVEANYDRVAAQTEMEGLLQKFGAEEIDAVYAQNDDNAMGAIAAIEAAGLKPGQDIKIFSCDGSYEAIKAIIAGKLVMTVDNPPRYGPIVCDTVEALERGESVNENILIESTVVDSSNALSAIANAY